LSLLSNGKVFFILDTCTSPLLRNKGLEGTPALNPDVIVLNRDEEQNVRGLVLSLKRWKGLAAVQNKRVKVMPCRLICHPNFHIVDVVEILSNYLYRDPFDAHSKP
jgi:ABC-type Fe3+-hydroxamate transport system substrate-binding protein